jgi:hypothetical protein
MDYATLLTLLQADSVNYPKLIAASETPGDGNGDCEAAARRMNALSGTAIALDSITRDDALAALDPIEQGLYITKIITGDAATYWGNKLQDVRSANIITVAKIQALLATAEAQGLMSPDEVTAVTMRPATVAEAGGLGLGVIVTHTDIAVALLIDPKSYGSQLAAAAAAAQEAAE